MGILLDKLASEIISLVCSYLDIASLCSLRLTSKSFKAESRPEFYRYFEIQDIDLTVQGLQRLCSLASSPSLSPGVRTLNLTCFYYHQPPSIQEVPATGIETISSVNIYTGRGYYYDTLSSEEQEEKWMAERQAEQVALTGADMC